MKKILIIEDDDVIANIYRSKFSQAGFDVKIASDGELGLELVKTFKPDLVHLDLQVPKVNGVEIIQYMRSQPELKSVPVIVLSNCYLSSLVREAWKAGASKCLSKTDCTPRMMLEIVSNVLARDDASAVPAVASTTPPAPAMARRSQTALEPGVDTTFQAEIRRAFLERAPRLLAALRERLQTLAKAESDVARMPEVFELCRAMHSLAGNASMASFRNIAQMSSALEALLKELYEKPKRITSSALRTVAHAIDFLADLFEHATGPETETAAPTMVLVVDDEILSRRAVCSALAKANLGAISVDDPQLALKLLQENRFSLIFLDVEMPGMNGFELCNKLRALPTSKTTPVVFVTSLNDFESRARSALSGGNDLIAKPFLLMELAVKALSYLLNNQMAANAKNE